MFLLFAATGASAQVRSGLSELNLNGDFTSTSDGDESFTSMQLQLQLRYGYFVTRAIELGATLSANKFEEVDTFGSFGAFNAYHFGAEGVTTVPYLGAQIAAGYGDDGDNPTTFGGFGGLKYFVGPAGALSAEAFVDRMSLGELDLTSFGVQIGVSIFV